MTLYLPLSFFFSTLNLSCKASLTRISHTSGFFLWAFRLFLGTSSVGLATEFAITILGPEVMALPRRTDYLYVS